MFLALQIGLIGYYTRLRVVRHTDSATLSTHVHQFTLPTSTVGAFITVTAREIVLHKDGEWARDADGDGLYGPGE